MTTDLPLTNELTTDSPSICEACGAPLCLRKQVVNLALGNIEVMHCLNCLGSESQRSGKEILAEIMPYIFSRDCFAKQWRKYETIGDCPDPHGCHVNTCFAVESTERPYYLPPIKRANDAEEAKDEADGAHIK